LKDEIESKKKNFNKRANEKNTNKKIRIEMKNKTFEKL
jgi:hypothetical protein